MSPSGDRGSYTRISLFIAWIADTIAANSLVVEDANFNQDGDVDGTDFLAWQRGFGVGSTLAQGDANGDRVVDAADLTVWENQFGRSSLSAFATVPEPTSGVLLLGVAGLGMIRWKQSQNGIRLSISVMD